MLQFFNQRWPAGQFWYHTFTRYSWSPQKPLTRALSGQWALSLSRVNQQMVPRSRPGWIFIVIPYHISVCFALWMPNCQHYIFNFFSVLGYFKKALHVYTPQSGTLGWHEEKERRRRIWKNFKKSIKPLLKNILNHYRTLKKYILWIWNVINSWSVAFFFFYTTVLWHACKHEVYFCQTVRKQKDKLVWWGNVSTHELITEQTWRLLAGSLEHDPDMDFM